MPSSLPPPFPKRDSGLVERFDALALSGRPSPGTTNGSHRDSQLSPLTSGGAFVGGFHPSFGGTRDYASPKPQGSAYSGHDPPRPGSLTPGYSPTPLLPRPPPLIPMPTAHHANHSSLTMQHALSAPPDTSPFPPSRPRPDLPPPSPPSRPHSGSAVPAPTSARLHPQTALLATPPRRRATSTPPSPASSVGGDGAVTQCSGVTKAGKRCTRQVKAGTALLDFDPDSQVERFCHQHTKEVLGPSGFYSRKVANVWINFEDWIPDYLQMDTRVALRVEMEKAHSQSDVPGYIYTFEIRDSKTPDKVHLKVGRAVNLVKRIDQWGKQCGSKEQVLRGWWPGTVEDDSTSLMKGRVVAGEKGMWCHRLERLVHLELADLAKHTPYLDPKFPKNGSQPDGAMSQRSGSSKPAAKRRCSDCGSMHKEIFTFVRVDRGPYKGKEWESIVKPVIEKWGAFVDAYV